MTRLGICRDYGLMAKVHLARIDGAWRVEAIEAIPLANTQTKPERFATKNAETRIYALNHLSAGLDDEAKGAKGVRFTPQSDGSGLYCADGAATLGGKIGTLCQITAGSCAGQADAEKPRRARTNHSTAGPPSPAPRSAAHARTRRTLAVPLRRPPPVLG
jgi:hypothetical protein